MSVSGTGTDAEDSAPHVQLDLFLKLGFSDAQVQAVVRKLGLRADTNRVLEELMQDGPPPHRDQQLPSGAGPAEPSGPDHQLRPVVIDGSNVAMSHGNKEVFSCLGIELSVKFFQQRGHTDITVFVPSWRKEPPRADVPITDQQILRRLEKQRLLVFTPSRRVAGKRVVCYDDRFIVKLAFELDGVIVSNDTYRDLQGERPEWKRFIEKRLLMFSFVNDKFMPPDDPLGRHGPSLDRFLQKSPCAPKKLPCPYGRKCTYGLKCKFLHTERSRRSRRSLTNEPPGHAPGPDLPRLLHHQLSLDARVSENVLVLRGDAAQKSLDSSLGSYESPSAEACWSRGGRKCCLGGPHSCPPAPERPERRRVREKLLAIFNAELVDRTMQMFPQLLDPQRLAAEILSGKSGASGPSW